MTKINNISLSQKPIITPKNTGYAATAGLVLTTVTAFSKNKTIRKSHKFLGGLTAFLTLLHIGVIEYLHFKYKKM